MIDLLNGEQKIQINQLGFIEYCSFDKSVTAGCPVYMVFFKEHSHLDPTCRQLDVNSIAANLQCKAKKGPSLSYNKSIEDIICQCCIELVDSGFDWTIRLQRPYPVNHRFGIVYPLENNVSILSFGEEIKSAVCNYFNLFKQTFRDQFLLKLPSLGIAGSNNQLILCSNPSQNTQFYIHRMFPWNIRTTSLTDNNEFILHVRQVRSSSEMHSAFTCLYSESKSYTEYNQLEKKYGICIKCYVGDDNSYQLMEYEYEIKQPSDKSLSHFNSVLQTELNKYPANFFDEINLGGIYLCSNIIRKVEDGSIHIPGFYLHGIEQSLDWLFFNVEMPFSWLIHHEMFHCIEQHLGACPWKHGNMSFFKDEFDLVPEDVRGFDDTEFRADLFGCLMSQGKKLKLLAGANELLMEQIALVMDFVSPIMDLFSVWSSPAPDQESRSIYAYTHGEAKRITFGKLVEADFYLSSPESQIIETLRELHNRN